MLSIVSLNCFCILLHQNEYKRGVSAWNFDIEDLKAQAALVSIFASLIFQNNQLYQAKEKEADFLNPALAS